MMAGQRKEAQDAGRDGDLFWMRNETFVETAVVSADRVSDSRYTERCGVESTALGYLHPRRRSRES